MSEVLPEETSSRSMDASEIFRHMVKMSGKSNRQISREIGKSDSFVSASLAQGVRPRIDTFVRIAEACGYEVEVRSKDDHLLLASPVIIEYDASSGHAASPSGEGPDV